MFLIKKNTAVYYFIYLFTAVNYLLYLFASNVHGCINRDNIRARPILIQVDKTKFDDFIGIILLVCADWFMHILPIIVWSCNLCDQPLNTPRVREKLGTFTNLSYYYPKECVKYSNCWHFIFFVAEGNTINNTFNSK